jgi:chemotaxis methyl-accepting protein methylase
LREGGFLLLGGTESVFGLSADFTRMDCEVPGAYRKASAAARRATGGIESA